VIVPSVYAQQLGVDQRFVFLFDSNNMDIVGQYADGGKLEYSMHFEIPFGFSDEPPSYLRCRSKPHGFIADILYSALCQARERLEILVPRNGRAGLCKLSKLNDISRLDLDFEEKRNQALVEVMGAPLARAVENWNRRFAEEIIPFGAEKGDLDDRIEDESWLLHRHGYSVSSSYGPHNRRSASVEGGHRDIEQAGYYYQVYSLDDLATPGHVPRQYGATGGRKPGQFEEARELADTVNGVVLERAVYRIELEDEERRARCVYLSARITPKAAYEAFMTQYDDGEVISRFLPVFERMQTRQHRNVEAYPSAPAQLQCLGEIAFYLAEVRSWKADRDYRVLRGKV